jgi:hypothetical protein
MSKKELIDIVRKLLKTGEDLSFLSNLTEDDLKTLVGCIRERVDSALGRDHGSN